ncbi:hypothetical protein J6590_010671 [Homalodisca vitripennis]|nr:hypothetical protein J6590_010671 [Homalodisca vitripennis]
MDIASERPVRVVISLIIRAARSNAEVGGHSLLPCIIRPLDADAATIIQQLTGIQHRWSGLRPPNPTPAFFCQYQSELWVSRNPEAVRLPHCFLVFGCKYN